MTRMYQSFKRATRKRWYRNTRILISIAVWVLLIIAYRMGS
ncbi:hypothetical protein [Ruegeria sp. Ofav3-42]|nr:hypothetical protein [Ruegeria sp. Ofav3-42]